MKRSEEKRVRAQLLTDKHIMYNNKIKNRPIYTVNNSYTKAVA